MGGSPAQCSHDAEAIARSANCGKVCLPPGSVVVHHVSIKILPRALGKLPPKPKHVTEETPRTPAATQAEMDISPSPPRQDNQEQDRGPSPPSPKPLNSVENKGTATLATEMIKRAINLPTTRQQPPIARSILSWNPSTVHPSPPTSSEKLDRQHSGQTPSFSRSFFHSPWSPDSAAVAGTSWGWPSQGNSLLSHSLINTPICATEGEQ